MTTLHPEVNAALRVVDAVYTEVPLDTQGMMAMMQGMRLPAGQTLTEMIPEDLRKRLDAQYKRINPMLSLKMFDTQKLFIAMSAPPLLEQPFNSPGEQSLDQQIWNLAKRLGKITAGIETMDEHIKVLDTLNTEESLQLLRWSLDMGDAYRAKGQDSIEDMIAIYLSAETDKFRVKFFELAGEDDLIMQTFYRAIMTVRNETMVEHIHEKITSEPTVGRFYAIGAAHCGDGDGLVDLLKEKGF